MLADVRTVDIEQSLALIEDWLNNYICQQNPQIGRPGVVCPFVGPSRRAGALEVRVRLVGPTPSLSLMIETARCGIEEFGLIAWKCSNPGLRALIIVLPDLPTDSLGLLDEAHAAVKPECVQRGMMIGQFHERCTEKAARNPLFNVSRSPVPLLAMRSMAIHDVFFLSERKEWLMTYVDRFGRYYRNTPNGLDPILTNLYWEACARHGIRG
jgi:heptaprenyl diphosphate synthase